MGQELDRGRDHGRRRAPHDDARQPRLLPRLRQRAGRLRAGRPALRVRGLRRKASVRSRRADDAGLAGMTNIGLSNIISEALNRYSWRSHNRSLPDAIADAIIGAQMPMADAQMTALQHWKARAEKAERRAEVAEAALDAIKRLL